MPSRQDLGEVRIRRLHAERRELGDVDRPGPVVAVLDQQPAVRRAAVAVRLDDHPRSFQLEAVQPKLQIALAQRRVDVLALGLPRAVVPQHHDAGAVAFRDDALEHAVVDTDDLRSASRGACLSDRSTAPSAPPTTAARRSTRGGSRNAGARRGASGRRRRARRLSFFFGRAVAVRLRRFLEVALLPVILEGHASKDTIPSSMATDHRPGPRLLRSPARLVHVVLHRDVGTVQLLRHARAAAAVHDRAAERRRAWDSMPRTAARSTASTPRWSTWRRCRAAGSPTA